MRYVPKSKSSVRFEILQLQVSHNFWIIKTCGDEWKWFRVLCNIHSESLLCSPNIGLGLETVIYSAWCCWIVFQRWGHKPQISLHKFFIIVSHSSTALFIRLQFERDGCINSVVSIMKKLHIEEDVHGHRSGSVMGQEPMREKFRLSAHCQMSAETRKGMISATISQIW